MKTWDELQKITCFGYSSYAVFSDFVEIALSALLSLTETMKYADSLERIVSNNMPDRYNERYLQIVKRYKENATRREGERPADCFARAWGCLQQETHTSQKDVLGEIYESQISHGEHGQFFTPDHLCRMIADMLRNEESGKRVIDPTCGSGRMLIASAQRNPDQHFVGIDVSPICVRMTALNMWLFDLNADIYEGNTLSGKMSTLWQVRRGGYIWEMAIKDGKIDAAKDLWRLESLVEAFFTHKAL